MPIALDPDFRDAVADLLAMFLGMDEGEILAGIDAAEQVDYQRFAVPKGDGTFRKLAAPSDALKRLQRAVLDGWLNRAIVSPFAHGFVPGRSIVTAANVHKPTATAIVTADIREAFPSTPASRVRRMIEWHLGPILKHGFPTAGAALRAAIFDTLTVVCTLDDALPQGAPTSGMLLNLACGRLDRLIARELLGPWRSRLANLHYTRYADDLTITARDPIPAELIDELGRLVLAAGYQLNRRKLEHYEARERDLVICGIRLYAGQLALPRATLRRYRALFDHAINHDADTIPTDLRDRIRGTLGLLRMVYPNCPAPLRQPLDRLLAVHGAWLLSTAATAPRPTAHPFDIFPIYDELA